MLSRCSNPRDPGWLRYGGRSPNPVIVEDPRWQDFESFLADMGERPEGKTLDRKDNSRGYCKGNCRWASPREQVMNRDGERNGSRTKPERRPRGDLHPNARLNEAHVVEIRKLYAAGVLLHTLAAQYGVGRSTIWAIVSRKNWRHVA